MTSVPPALQALPDIPLQPTYHCLFDRERQEAIIANLRDGSVVHRFDLLIAGNSSLARVADVQFLTDALNLADAATKVGHELLQGAVNLPRTAVQNLWNDALLRVLAPSVVAPPVKG